MAERRWIKEMTTQMPPLGKCQQDPSPREAGGSALGAWPAGLGVAEVGITEALLEPDGGAEEPAKGEKTAPAEGPPT